MYGDNAHFLAFGTQVIDRLLDRLGHRTHRDDDILGIGIAIVNERLVLAAGNFADLDHRLGGHVGNRIVETVGGLTRLEIDVGILGGTARNGVLGIQRTLAELGECLLVEQSFECLVVDQLDLLDLVRRTETVEEMHERHAGFDRQDMGQSGQVHHLLHAAGSQHRKARLAGCHNVLMVAEDRKALRSQGAGRNMEHAREQFTGDFVHVGDHQQQPLRSGERRSQRAALQRTVHCTGCARLGLHLDHFDRFAEDVLTALCSPFVHQFGHRRRRRDGVNSSHLAEHIRDVCRCIVTVTSNKFFLCHLTINYYVNMCFVGVKKQITESIIRANILLLF